VADNPAAKVFPLSTRCCCTAFSCCGVRHIPTDIRLGVLGAGGGPTFVPVLLLLLVLSLLVFLDRVLSLLVDSLDLTVVVLGTLSLLFESLGFVALLV